MVDGLPVHRAHDVLDLVADVMEVLLHVLCYVAVGVPSDQYRYEERLKKVNKTFM